MERKNVLFWLSKLSIYNQWQKWASMGWPTFINLIKTELRF